jgi:hypothetical protein
VLVATVRAEACEDLGGDAPGTCCSRAPSTWASDPPWGEKRAARALLRLAHRGWHIGCGSGGGGSNQIEDETLILWLLHMDGYHELVVRGRGRGITARLREGARAAGGRGAGGGAGTRGRGHRGVTRRRTRAGAGLRDNEGRGYAGRGR